MEEEKSKNSHVSFNIENNTAYKLRSIERGGTILPKLFWSPVIFYHLTLKIEFTCFVEQKMRNPAGLEDKEVRWLPLC